MATSPTQELPSTSPMPAGLLAGRYQVLSVLGRGAMGDVYLARHVHAGRTVALKVVTASFASDERICQRVRAEAQACSAARHPNIVEVFDAGELEDGRPYVAMEYLEGRRLLDLYEAEGPLPIARACRILADVARAIAAAHKVGIIHRDLKAENVMLVVRDGVELVKVLDFGIAAAVSPEGGRATMPGIGIGTPEYMAPEQVYGSDPTPRFDIYALGVLMFEGITGTLPFADDQPSLILQRKATTPAPAITDRRPDVPAPLAKLIDACLALEPTDRPQNVDELIRVLDSYVAESATAIGLDGPNEERRRRGVSIFTAGAVVTGLIVLIALWPREPAATVDDTVVRAEPKPREVTPLPTPITKAEVVVPAPVVAPPTPDPIVTPPVPPADDQTAKGATTPKKRIKDPALPSLATPEPVPEKPTVDPTTAPDCERLRGEADDARKAHDWTTVLETTKKSSCWKSNRDRTRMRVKAYLELLRFAECVQAAGSIDDAEIIRDKTICEKRM